MNGELDYKELLARVKERIAQSQVRAAVAVNRELEQKFTAGRRRRGGARK